MNIPHATTQAGLDSTGESPPPDDTEDMLVRIFGRREVIETQPDDPARLAAIYEEWRVFYWLTWWRNDPEAQPIKERRLQEFMRLQRRRNARRRKACA